MRASVLCLTVLWVLTQAPASAQLACTGDCNLDSQVTVDEALIGVNIALGLRNRHDCPPMDPNNDQAVTIDELIQAVHFALEGCPPEIEVCRTSADCSQSFPCLAPGEFRGCGACQRLDSDCSTDADCVAHGAHFICAPPPATACACSPVDICQAGCLATTDCAAGQECDATHRCVPRNCSADPSVCPSLFACVPATSSSICLRRTCQDDQACRGGFCVNALCYDELGTCSAPVP